LTEGNQQPKIQSMCSNEKVIGTPLLALLLLKVC
jgi:hypothetical protein